MNHHLPRLPFVDPDLKPLHLPDEKRSLDVPARHQILLILLCVLLSIFILSGCISVHRNVRTTTSPPVQSTTPSSPVAEPSGAGRQIIQPTSHHHEYPAV